MCNLAVRFGRSAISFISRLNLRTSCSSKVSKSVCVCVWMLL